MAIITLSEFKLTSTYLLNTTLFSDDTTTQALIDEAEQAYLNVRGKAFKKITGDPTNSSAIIANISYYDMQGLFKNMFVRGTNIIGLIIDINDDGTQITLENDATGTATDEEMFVYPAQAQQVMAQIVLFLRQTASADLSKKSESIEKHSWTFFGQMDVKSGLPLTISNRIKSYLSVKEGQITDQGYYKGREEIAVNDVDIILQPGSAEVTE